jgi:DNA repair photolyase
MIIKEIQAKSIITKTNLPGGDFVINPYTGCPHACKYCYARFMKRFTGHKEEWGDFCDAKINAPELIPENTDKYKGKQIVIGSVTDPYNPVEEKYKLTRKILAKLFPLQPNIDILTKSSLVTRDIDLLKKFNDCNVALSISVSDEETRKILEPGAPSIESKFKALKELHKEGIKTTLFISPIFPFLTNWKGIIKETKEFVNEYWLENLNLYGSIKKNINNFLRETNPELIKEYEEIYSPQNNYWKEVEEEVKKFCEEEKVKFKIFFHHKEERKNA